MNKLLAAALIFTAPLGAQVDSTASIGGIATSWLNGQPLSGVMISVPAARRFVVTDSTGTFALAGLRAGAQKIRVTYQGQDTEEYDFTLASGSTKQIAVLLNVDAVDLAPLVVEAQHPDQWRDLGGFYSRRKLYAGFARFFTLDDIEHAHATRISSLLALERIVTRCFQGCRPVRISRGRPCLVPVSVDGFPQQEEEYDRIPIKDVAGIEVYRGNPPYGLAQGMALGPGPSVWQGESSSGRATCGAVLIWTRLDVEPK